MGVSTSNKLFEAIGKIIELPEHCKHLVINLPHDGLPTMNAVCYVVTKDSFKPEEVTKTFVITEKE